jgi:hypothetical protein
MKPKILLICFCLMAAALCTMNFENLPPTASASTPETLLPAADAIVTPPIQEVSDCCPGGHCGVRRSESITRTRTLTQETKSEFATARERGSSLCRVAAAPLAVAAKPARLVGRVLLFRRR